ncbi:hypothetical protein MPSEU_001030400 [Mayamaea pseudoterrestris]|nr:hypothetical protein MPSEU_001030400 [Mayamaea pseudoterrestris]GKZ00787.1 hypothetical protein MPSEU_001030400 [Mayamaea pseudoterrestris]
MLSCRFILVLLLLSGKTQSVIAYNSVLSTPRSFRRPRSSVNIGIRLTRVNDFALKAARDEESLDAVEGPSSSPFIPSDLCQATPATMMIKGYDPSEGLPESVNVGDPQQRVAEKERSVTSILRELVAIQQKGPQKYCILGTRHCSYMHQQIIELLAYALVLSGNHVYTSGAGGTHAATIRGALRAERPDLLTVVLPQSMDRQTKESQSLLKKVTDLITMPQNDDMPLDVASRICNSYLLQQTDQLISFAFHESSTVIEATKEAKKLDMLVTTLYLD